MWVNPLFEIASQDAALAVARANPLATLVVEKPLRAAHLPVLIERSPDGSLVAVGHVPLVDPLSQAIDVGATILIIFSGPSSYISPSWYTRSGLPTYNFETLHVRGPATPMADNDELKSHLRTLAQVHETAKQPPAEPWVFDATAEARMESLLPQIVGFRVPIAEMHAKAKLGQNRSAADQASVAEALAQSSSDADQQISRKMSAACAEREHS